MLTLIAQVNGHLLVVVLVHEGGHGRAGAGADIAGHLCAERKTRMKHHQQESQRTTNSPEQASDCTRARSTDLRASYLAPDARRHGLGAGRGLRTRQASKVSEICISEAEEYRGCSQTHSASVRGVREASALRALRQAQSLTALAPFRPAPAVRLVRFIILLAQAHKQ